MKSRYPTSLLAVFVLSLFLFSVKAETVSQKQAQQMAQQFFNEAEGRVVAPVKLIYNGRKLTTDRLFAPFYVYNNPTGGFVIISAENKTYPILGFSLKDSFDPERLGETEKALLKSYAREIELIRYDTSIPYQAIEAWTDYPAYVVGTLSAYYNATDPIWPVEDVYENLYLALEPDHNPSFSDIYTPEQWQEMVNEELDKNSNVAIGVIENNQINPIIVHGRQGDYYRLEMSKRNNWLMRLNASELISANMIGLFNNPIMIEDSVKEEEPFIFVDDFNEEVAEIEAGRMSKPMTDMVLFVDEPYIKGLGSGHFEIVMPEQALLATVYNLGGAVVNQRTFKNSNSVFIDLSAEPNGFYFVRVVGESGVPYGMKLYR